MKRITILTYLFLLLLLLPSVFSLVEYKPYLHKATVPDHPKLALSGTSVVELFTGTEKFTYPFIIPSGTNGMQPSLELMYESSKTAERSSLVGTGWSLNENYIMTNVNSTVSNASDDIYELMLNGAKYELVYVPSENKFHTKQEQFFLIENVTGATNGDASGRYWVLKTKDGTMYRFGFNADSTMIHNQNTALVWRWSLDLVNDTHENQIFYTYGENIFPADRGAVYLTKIEYNNERKRVVNFFYETTNRPDLWMQYDNGAAVNESRRLKEVFMTADGSLVRRYVLEYTQLNSTSRSALLNITIFGSDNSTTLPPVKFSYRSPNPGWASSSVWDPPTSMNFVDATNEDIGVRFADLNRDGYQDIIKIRGGGGNERWLSNGNGWQNTTLWDTTGLPDFVLSNGQDNGTRIEDMNNDGLPDIINARGDARAVYLNTGIGWVQNNAWNLSEGMGFVDVAAGRDLGVRLVDLNADGWVDVVKATTANRTVFLNNGKNTPATPWIVADQWLVPTGAVFVVDGTSRDLGVRFADVNADGYVDLLKANSSDPITVTVRTWLNTGNGWTEDPLWNVPIGAVFVNGTAEEQGVRIVDVNGDRLPDLLAGFGTTLQTWLNNGSGWTLNNTWAPPITFVDSSGRNKGVRVVDVNGDELPDILKHDANLSVIAAYVDNAAQGYLLDKVVFDFGGTEEFGYKSSTLFNESGQLLDALNFNLWLVTNVSRDNNMSGAHVQEYNRTYNYSYGLFDFRSRQFRGFGYVEERRNETLWKHWYHQDDARSGKEVAVAVLNRTNNALYQNTSYDWSVANTNGYNTTLLVAQRIDSFDGTNSFRSVNSSFSYDVFGNTVEVNNSGDMEVSGDESYQKFVYTTNSALWVVNTLANHSVYGFNSGVLMKQTLYRYDNTALYATPTKGDITIKTEWSNSSADIVSYYGYDSYGNVVQMNNSLNRTTNYTFESTFTFVNRTENAKGQKTKYVYSLGFGNLLNVTDSNNIETNYTYDALGRITKEIQPFDSDVYPTKEYVYSIDGVAPEQIIVMQKENSGSTPTLDTRYFYDGFGNLIQVKTEAENSALQIAGDIYYDSLDRPVKTSNPYYVSFSGAYSTANNSVAGFNYSYDPLDRVVQVLNPDNTRIQINFTLWNVSTLDERGKRKDYILDGNGNIVRVVEFYNNGTNIITYNTTYKYDALNQLTQINDSKGNQFNFTYDSLGRTIRLQDPDLRTWNYTYDSLGNLIAQEGAGGELTTDGDYYKEYNALHQLTKIRKKTATGKIIEEYSYGPDGERIMTVNYLTNTTIYTPFREWMMIVNRTGSYNYTYVYDGNTLVARKNPDGTKWFYHDDHLGSTSLITDQDGNIVEETFYNPFGQVTSGGEREAYLLYTNQMKDAIGCYDYGARVYCPKWYHFTSADTKIQDIYNSKSLNRYSYVWNNPYLYKDPSGELSWKAVGGGTATAGFGVYMMYVGYGVAAVNPPLGATMIVAGAIMAGSGTAVATGGVVIDDDEADIVNSKDLTNAGETAQSIPAALTTAVKTQQGASQEEIIESTENANAYQSLIISGLNIKNVNIKELIEKIKEWDKVTLTKLAIEGYDIYDALSEVLDDTSGTGSPTSSGSNSYSSSTSSGKNKGYGTGSYWAALGNNNPGGGACDGCGSISQSESRNKKGSKKSGGSSGSNSGN